MDGTLVAGARCWTGWSRPTRCGRWSTGRIRRRVLPLLVGLRERTVKAFDLTFSAPKSASVLWALGSEPVADVVMGAHREAVADRARVLGGTRRAGPRPGRWGSPPRADRRGGRWRGSCIARPGPVTRRCTPIAWSRTSCAGRTGGVWRSPPGRCSCGPGRPGRCIRPSCNGCSACGWAWSGSRIGTTPARSPGSTPEALRTFSKRTVEIEAELEATGATLRVAGVADASRRRGLAGDPPGQGPHRHPGDAVRSVADRGRRGRPGRSVPGWSVGCAGVTPTCAPLGFDEIARRLVDEDTGLCAHAARFAEHDVIEHIAGLAAGRLSTGEITGLARPVPGVGSGRPAHPEGDASGWEPAALVDRRPPPTSRTTPSSSRPARRPTRRPDRRRRSSPRGSRESEFLGADQRQAVVDVVRAGRIGARGARPGRLRQDRDGPRRRRTARPSTAAR